MASVENLTDGERLYILRRRKGLTQAQMAATLGVHRNTYGPMELSTEDLGMVLEDLGELAEAEQCIIKRRREGMTQHELAKKMGISRQWLYYMENGEQSCAALVEFWGL